MTRNNLCPDRHAWLCAVALRAFGFQHYRRGTPRAKCVSQRLAHAAAIVIGVMCLFARPRLCH